MFGGAVACRAVLGIAAALVFGFPAQAQNEADRLVHTFADKTADEAQSKKQAGRSAARSKSLEVRERAEAQRAKAIARIRAEQTRAAEEEEMLARARREADEAKAAAEIHRLIEEAEAARLHAEMMLRTEPGQAPASTAQAAGPDVEQGLERLEQAAHSRTLEAEAEAEVAKAAREAHLAATRAAEHQHRLATLARVRDARQARLASQARRLAQETEAARQEAVQEAARTALARAVETRHLVTRLAHVRRLREGRVAAQARQLAQAGEAERARSAEKVAAQARLDLLARREEAAGHAEEAASAGSLERRVLEERRNAPREARGAEHQVERAAPHAQGRRRVTVLLIMAPGTYGIRRRAKTADPVLCVLDGCYVSAGAHRAARFMPRRRALGFGNTLGGRAGACRASLSCVFRDLVLEFPDRVQPVDLHIFKHDRREPQVVVDDSDCGVVAGRLTCDRAVYAHNYVLWIVPERVAALAGPDGLERALRDGLSASRSAEAFASPVR